MANYLGIDYGRSQVGIAMATTPLAEPLVSVPLDQAFERIHQLINDHGIGTLVVGLSEGAMADETRTFVAQLKHTVTIPIVFQDETLSSQTAQSRLQLASKKKRQGPDHHYAAAVILQEYLDTH